MIARYSGRLPSRYSKIGDDVASVRVSDGHVVIKTDMLVDKTDVPPGMTYRQAARKAVAMCVSDFSAKGVRPDSFLVSIGLPRGSTEDQVRELALGFKDASNEWSLNLIGGDTGEASDLVIDCVMVGFAKRVVWRSGAKPGELVVTTGYFGYPPSGLKLLMGGAKATEHFSVRAKASVVRPSPNLAAGLVLARYLSSSMDSSDGLAICLHDIAEASGVGISLNLLPVKKDVRAFARSNDLPLERLVLGGGEEYLIVGTLAEASYRKAREEVRTAGGDLISIGRVNGKKGKVEMVEGGRAVRIDRIGWTHLS